MKIINKFFLTKLNEDIFTISAITFIAFFFIEQIKSKFVIAYINLNHILLICLITGIFAILSDKEENPEKKQEKTSIYWLLLISAVIFLFLLVFLLKIGIWGVLISFAGGLVSFLLGQTIVSE